MFLDQPEDRGGIEAPDHDLLGAQHGGGLRAAPSIGVEQRNGVQVDDGFRLAI